MKCKQYNIIATFIFMLSFLCLFPQKVSAQQTKSNNTQASVQSQASIRLNKAGSVVERGQKVKLKARISNSRSKKVVWKSSKRRVATVNRNGQVIARGYNRRNADKTVLSHAELTSIKTACKKEGDWRLEDCKHYVTLQPSPMCAGAIVQARIPRVVIGSMNSKAGCAGSVLNLLKEPGFNHQAQVVTGILEEECSEMMSSFFTELRKKKRLPETP